MYYSVRSFGFYFDFYLLLSISFFLVRSLGLQSIILVFLSILYIYIYTYMYFLTMQKLNNGAVLRRRMNYYVWKWNCLFPKLCVFFLLPFCVSLVLFENQSLRPRCVSVAQSSLHGTYKYKMPMASCPVFAFLCLYLCLNGTYTLFYFIYAFFAFVSKSNRISSTKIHPIKTTAL